MRPRWRCALVRCALLRGVPCCTSTRARVSGPVCPVRIRVQQGTRVGSGVPWTRVQGMRPRWRCALFELVSSRACVSGPVCPVRIRVQQGMRVGSGVPWTRVQGMRPRWRCALLHLHQGTPDPTENQKLCNVPKLYLCKYRFMSNLTPVFSQPSRRGRLVLPGAAGKFPADFRPPKNLVFRPSLKPPFWPKNTLKKGQKQAFLGCFWPKKGCFWAFWGQKGVFLVFSGPKWPQNRSFWGVFGPFWAFSASKSPNWGTPAGDRAAGGQGRNSGMPPTKV